MRSKLSFFPSTYKIQVIYEVLKQNFLEVLLTKKFKVQLPKSTLYAKAYSSGLIVLVEHTC